MNRLYDSAFKLVAKTSRKLNDKWFGGTSTESLSGRSYRLRNQLGWRISRNFINMLFFWQEDHCKMIHESEVERGMVDESAN
jgi:hypothetical protein